MADQTLDLQAARRRLEELRRSIARHRHYLDEGASPLLQAAYLRSIHEAEAEVAEIERDLARENPSPARS
jgi:TATA-binding protein-associated factor Taf7